MNEVVVSIWNDFGDRRWDHLIDRMPEQIQTVTKGKGGCTRFESQIGLKHFILYSHKVSR